MPTNLPAPFAGQPWNRADITLADEVTNVPTMLTDEEGQLLHWLCGYYATGVGAVCDVGCFAGGSTARLASGVVTAGRQTPVHGWDFFNIHDRDKERFLYPAGVPEFEGRNMLPAVRELLHPWRDVVHLHRGDIANAEWDGSPIEVLFVDGGKTPALTDHIATTFMPSLIPGRSILVQQDYMHWRQAWIPAQTELMKDTFELVGYCRRNSAVFLCTKQVTDQTLAEGRVDGLSDDVTLRLVADAMRRLPRYQQNQLARSMMGVQDNPGVRIPREMSKAAFSPSRAEAILAEVAAAS